jgi:anti-sigma B factor antagonist
MKVLERAVKDITILDVTGTFSKGAGATVLHAVLDRLLAENKPKVLLNFAGVTRVEPDAVAELLDSSAVSRSGEELKLVNLTERIQGLIQITKLLTSFDVYESGQEALSSFATPPTEIAQSESPADYLGNFFPISPELTLRIVETNTALVMRELESMADEDSDELGLKQDESPDQSESVSSEGRELVDTEEPSSSKNNVEAYVRTIRERIYQFVAVLARGEHARSGKPYELFKVFPLGVRTLFGLDDTTDQFYDLPTEVTQEFRNWLLKSGKYYRAPRGEIRLEDDVLLRLTAADVPNGGSGRPYSRAFYTFGKPGNRAG